MGLLQKIIKVIQNLKKIKVITCKIHKKWILADYGLLHLHLYPPIHLILNLLKITKIFNIGKVSIKKNYLLKKSYIKLFKIS